MTAFEVEDRKIMARGSKGGRKDARDARRMHLNSASPLRRGTPRDARGNRDAPLCMYVRVRARVSTMHLYATRKYAVVRL